mgnify:CR=1 FL=1
MSQALSGMDPQRIRHLLPAVAQEDGERTIRRHRNIRFRSAALTVLLVAPFAQRALAQIDTASVSGALRDPSGRLVPRAVVSLINLGTGIERKGISDDAGNHLLVSAPIGRYEAPVEAHGFRSARSEAFDLTVASRRRVDFRLELAAVESAVEVTARAGALETDSSDRSHTVNSKQIVELPLNGRSDSQLASLNPGVSPTSQSEGGPTSVREGTFSAKGLRSTFNNFLLDGLDNNYCGTSNQGFSSQVAQLPPDAVAEFKLTTNNMSAEYGRSAGAVVNAVMRGGTNSLHGTLWNFFPNTSLNAVDFFRPVENRKPQLNRNQFGFAPGGPVLRNRTFFFVDYEGYREVTSQVQFANLPYQNFRNGIIGPGALPGGANYLLRNPFTGAIHGNGIIPQSDTPPYARRVFAELPPPASAASPLVNNYSRLVRVTNYRDKGDGKLDHNFPGRLRGFLRYSRSRADLFDEGAIPGIAGGGGNGSTRIPLGQAIGGVTWVLDPASLLEFRAGFSRSEAGKSPVLAGGASMQELLGVPGLPTDRRFTGGITAIVVPGIYPPTFLGRQATYPQYQHPVVWNPKTNYSRTAGRHSLKTGIEFQSVNIEQLDVNPILGRGVYFGLFREVPNFPVAATNPNLTALVSLADFLPGARSTCQIANPVIVNGRQRMWFAYLQDDCKASSRLTLNLGLRYEYSTPYFERDNLLSNWDPQSNAMISARPGSMAGRALVDPDRNNFAPRLGAAFSLDRRTVPRGGYGLSCVHWNRTGSRHLSLNGPHVVWATVNQTPGMPGDRRAQEGYPADLGNPSSFNPLKATVQYMPRDTRTPLVRSWFFGVQRELAANRVLEAAYVGNDPADLLTFNDVNQARPNRPGEPLLVRQRRPNQKFASIVGHLPLAFSNYHGLQAKLEKSWSGGLYLLNSFTWSKTIDNAGQALEGGLSESVLQDAGNPRNDKGPSSFDRTLNNVTSVVFEMPFGRGRRYPEDHAPRGRCAARRVAIDRHPELARRDAVQRALRSFGAGRGGSHHSDPWPQSLPDERSGRPAGGKGGAHGGPLAGPDQGFHPRPHPAVRQFRPQSAARPRFLPA